MSKEEMESLTVKIRSQLEKQANEICQIRVDLEEMIKKVISSFPDSELNYFSTNNIQPIIDELKQLSVNIDINCDDLNDLMKKAQNKHFLETRRY